VVSIEVWAELARYEDTITIIRDRLGAFEGEGIITGSATGFFACTVQRHGFPPSANLIRQPALHQLILAGAM
jgi:hypothetical protein